MGKHSARCLPYRRPFGTSWLAAGTWIYLSSQAVAGCAAADSCSRRPSAWHCGSGNSPRVASCPQCTAVSRVATGLASFTLVPFNGSSVESYSALPLSGYMARCSNVSACWSPRLCLPFFLRIACGFDRGCYGAVSRRGSAPRGGPINPHELP